MKGRHLKSDEINKIFNHYTEIIGKECDVVLHEQQSDDLHIDIAFFSANETCPYHVLATVGMSGYKMAQTNYSNIELIVFLDKNLNINKDNIKDLAWAYILDMISTTARLPMIHNTFLGFGHTIAKDENYTPYNENTDICSCYITLPYLLPTSVFELKIKKFLCKKSVYFWCLTGLNRENCEYVQKNGAEQFENKMAVENPNDTYNFLVIK